MSTKRPKFTDAEVRTIKALIGAKKHRLPVASGLEVSARLVKLGIVSVDESGAPSIPDDGEWHLISMGEYQY